MSDHLKLPGARTGLAYIWAIMLGPMLLFVAGVALLTLGFWRDVESVAAIGAIGIVAGLLLPRMQGDVEIGPSGIKGNLENDLFRGVMQKAIEGGAPAEQAIELASEATGPSTPSATLFRRTARSSPKDVADVTEWILDQWTTQFVAEHLSLEQESAAIVERVAHEKGWQVARHVRIGTTEGESRTFDLVIETPEGSIFIESVYARNRQSFSEVVRTASAALRDEKVLAAFLVVPNDRAAAAYIKPENLAIVPVGDLERQLREIPA